MAAARLRQRFRFLNDREKKEGCLILLNKRDGMKSLNENRAIVTG